MPYTIVGPHARSDIPTKSPAGPAAPGQDAGNWVHQLEATAPLNLSVSIHLEFFAAMKKLQFDRLNHETLRHLIGHETLRHLISHAVRRAKLQTSSGKVAQIRVPSEQQLDAANDRDIEFPPGSWVVNRDTSIDPDRPDWFDHCKIFIPPYSVERSLSLAHSRAAADKAHVSAVPRFSALGRLGVGNRDAATQNR